MSTGRRIIAALASLKLTLALIVVFAALLLYAVAREQPVGMLPALPLGLLFVNLVAAVIVHERLRRQTGLLVFHLGMAALALVAALGRLLAFDGHVEVTESSMLDTSQIVVKTEAPFHRWRMNEVLFVQRGFTIDYDPGMKRGHTRSIVAVPDGRGGTTDLVVGDDKPLILGGYRFYTTFNKGFAPLLTWIDSDGTATTGAVHMPSYPIEEDRQVNEWAPPDGSAPLTLWLELAAPIYDEHGTWSFKAPKDASLIVLDGERREPLRPGQSVAIGTGHLRYDGVTTWMGYTIFYDPMLPWLMAAAVITIGGLALHVVVRLRSLTDGPAWRQVTDGV